MRRNAVGIDLDGVVAWPYALWVEQFNRNAARHRHHPISVVDITSYSMLPDFCGSCWNACLRTERYAEDAELVPGAREGIRALWPHVDVYFLTARPRVLEPATLRWLRLHGLANWGLVHTQHKRDECVALRLVALVDDCPDNLAGMDDTCEPILFCQPWNLDTPAGRATYIGNWDALTPYLIERYGCQN